MGTSIDALDGDLRQGLQELLQLLAQNGLQGRITSTVRTFREQKFLWDRYKKGQSQLPAAPPGHSAHERGWAFDMVVSPYDYQTDVGNAWEKYWGGSYGGEKDPVHFELPGASAQAYQLGEQGGDSVETGCKAVPDVGIIDYIGTGLSFYGLAAALLELGYVAASEDEAVRLAKMLHLPVSADELRRHGYCV